MVVGGSGVGVVKATIDWWVGSGAGGRVVVVTKGGGDEARAIRLPAVGPPPLPDWPTHLANIADRPVNPRRGPPSRPTTDLTRKRGNRPSH